ncbi:MAG: ester cyclase [Terriglobales bacterium]
MVNQLMLDANKNTVRSFVGAVNAKDWPALRRLVAPEFRRHSVAAGEPGVVSVDDLIQFLEREYSAFPDAFEAIDDIIAEGNKVAVRHRFRGTQLGGLGLHPPSGKVLEATYLAIYRVEEDRIVEAWAEWDNMAALKQLGHQDMA